MIARDVSSQYIEIRSFSSHKKRLLFPLFFMAATDFDVDHTNPFVAQRNLIADRVVANAETRALSAAVYIETHSFYSSLLTLFLSANMMLMFWAVSTQV